VPANLSRYPWGLVFPAIALAGLAGVWRYSRRSQERKAFLASCAYLVGMISSAAFGLYPYVLPSITDPARGLTIENAAAHEYGLRIGLVWWIIGMALVAVYFTYVYRQFAGKVNLGREGEGY
jgi:cytochrome d ubiquinol oxidase subunit II